MLFYSKQMRATKPRLGENRPTRLVFYNRPGKREVLNCHLELEIDAHERDLRAELAKLQ
jgi:hypothetical protein